MPSISVVMSVYNCEKYVAQTIQSVIEQTFCDWEFIIINDASKDRSAEIIRSFSDERIVFIDNIENKGQCNNLNYGISIAKGKYIARLDHDDLCYPNRFEKQFKYMESHKDIAILGSNMYYLEDDKEREAKGLQFKNPGEMRFSHTFYNYGMPHSSFFVRRDFLMTNSVMYDNNYRFCEDYRLLLQCLEKGNIYCMQERLIAYRVFPEQTTQTIGISTIREEELRCREAFLDFNNADEYLYKAIRRQLKTINDYIKFIRAIRAYAISCGIENNNGIIKQVERTIIFDNKRTVVNCIFVLLAYL